MQYEDGTNVLKGTDCVFQSAETQDWYRPRESRPSSRWRKKAERLLERFESLSELYRPVSCVVTQKRVPAHGRDNPHLHHLDEARLISGGPGLSREDAQLFDRSMATLAGEFAVNDATGKPIQFTNGRPVGLRFGLSRIHHFLEGPNFVGEDRELPGPKLTEACRDAGKLLYELPTELAVLIWVNWKSGFAKDVSHAEFRWLDCLFELAWQSDHIPTSLTRYAWREYSSVALTGGGLFPRLPDLRDELSEGFATSIPNEAGYPTEYYSKLDDVARTSCEVLESFFDSDLTPVTRKTTNESMKTFISYCHADERFRERLEVHLKPLVTGELIAPWHDREIVAGMDWDREISSKLEECDVFLALLSPDFVASDYCRGVELKRALERGQDGTAVVIGVLLKACDWQSVFTKTLLLLPQDAKPVVDWKTQDEAWAHVAKEIRRSIEVFSARQSLSDESAT